MLLVVCSIAFSCGVNSKAYETLPPYFTPFSVNSVDAYNNSYSASVDPNNVPLDSTLNDAFNYNVFGVLNTSYTTQVYTSDHSLHPLQDAVAFPIEIDISAAEFSAEDLTVSLNVLDVYPFIESGYCPSINNGPDVIINGSRSISPLCDIYLSYYFTDVDYEPRPLPVEVHFSYMENGLIRNSSISDDIRLNEEIALQNSSIDHFTVYDEINLSGLPDSAWITGIDIHFSTFIRDYLDTSPESTFMAFQVVQLPREPSDSRLAERFLANVVSPSTIVPDAEGSYQEGYLDGLNKGQTESLGVVDWLLEAGDAVMNFQLFRVGNTPVTIGSIFTVIIGSLLIIFILKVFAGG